eukprot:TRINITY_DN2797_c0_g1_i1.p1 TRINITY_DN2797_c0_g1~~TRINITY_DN2797_c0_g1_i1.p1  ORF type:complete len:448 (+),score=170.24 TRINITY_DN2797_c0_g1_i1:169-1512(+)
MVTPKIRISMYDPILLIELTFQKNINYDVLKELNLTKDLLTETILSFIPENVNKIMIESELNKLLDDMRLFNVFGKGISENESLLLLYSLKKFSKVVDSKHIRFWGKFLTTSKPYYVIEVDTLKNDAPFNDVEPIRRGEKKPTPPGDNPGLGTNKFVYYVCNSLVEEWQKLGHTNPEHINLTRSGVQLLTGDLKKIFGSGCTEGEYLRALIARIAHSTLICPADSLVPVEVEEMDEDEEKPTDNDLIINEDWEGLETMEPVTMENIFEEDGPLSTFVHFRPEVLPQGRVFYYNTKYRPQERPADAESDWEEEEFEDEEPEEAKELFTTIVEDKQINNMGSWIVCTGKSFGGKTPILVASQRWKGAYAVALGRSFANIYVGWGLKTREEAFRPAELPVLMAESKTVQEELDPTLRQEEDFEAYLREQAEAAKENEQEKDDDEDNESDY